MTPGPANRNGLRVTRRSVRGFNFGLFLSEVFDKWVRRDVGVIFIPLRRRPGTARIHDNDFRPGQGYPPSI